MSANLLPQPSPDMLRQAIHLLPGVTPLRLESLQRLGIETVYDLLFHFPRSYEDLSDVRAIAALSSGKLQSAQGEVIEIDGRHLADGRSVVSVVLSDDGKTCLEGVWFNQTYAASRFRYGQRLVFSGKPKWYRDHWQMSTPRVQVLDDAGGQESPGIVPVYPLTEDLRGDQLRQLLRRAVDRCAQHLPEILPQELRQLRGWPDAGEALRRVHFPTTFEEAESGRRRFVYEEFLVLQLALALRRRELRARQRAPKLTTTPAIDARIRQLFSFQLTADQDRAVAEISRDLETDRPMQRLLQADVGAGKTVVAIYALLATVANKHQAALMAPTEVLARQHWQTLEEYLARSRVQRLLLTGSLSLSERKAALQAIREGKVDLVVGTQALVQEDVQFARLGLVVIDEQHKFGVHQRAHMRRLGIDPHYLVMTATPIPRTMALTVFGDLDVSIIRQLPPGRQPVQTHWIAETQREALYARLREELSQGRQAFVVCPLVEESAILDLKAAAQTYTELQNGPFQEFSVGLLHGRLEEVAKASIMQRFRQHELDILVCTSVIEVGVDVPNATWIVVEHAERFGLSQLHQLRGRISRGNIAGQCYLFAEASTDEARDRLRAFVRTRDGFALADEDARLRGIGQFFGTRQHGLGEIRVGDLVRGAEILQWARKDAFALVAADAGLRQPNHALLRSTVMERYGHTLELAEVG